MKIFMGLMSGTSMDGIDAALIDAGSNQFIAGITTEYSQEVQKYLKDNSREEKNHPGFFSQLNTLIGREFAFTASQLLLDTGYNAADIIAIGSHGQTICHNTQTTIPYTVQLGCAHTIAEHTGITVVADFRSRDLVVGGQGAPFAPIYHQSIFKHLSLPLAVINIGGISNITCLINQQDILGYDLGPGNCLMDLWIRKHHGFHYDAHGEWAAQGRVIEPLLHKLLADPYFKQQAPKSIGKEYFSLDWLERFLQVDYQPIDIQATLVHLTAQAIAQGVKSSFPQPIPVILCGGGVHNRTLVKLLADYLPQYSIESTAAYNINPDFIEAMMFAWLAEKTISNTPLNLRQITGAKHSAILGAIYPAGIDKRISPGV